MPDVFTIAVVSDIHYASDAEKARGGDYEIQGVANPLLRLLLKMHRHFIWLRHPLEQNHLLDTFLERVGSVDFAVANGDYTCDTRSVGVSDDASCQSAAACLGKLRAKFGGAFRASIGDHDLGKLSMVGAKGGMRVASYRRLRQELRLDPFWQVELGNYVLIGVTSSLVALPIFEPDILPDEKAEWERLRDEHMTVIREAFSKIKPDRRILLFCHDPTALPFLWREPKVFEKLPQIEQTIIGHLHTNLVLWKSRLLAGMPPIRFLGNSAKRMSTALHQARYWKPFHVRLCPALAGVELLKDGGFCTIALHTDPRRPLDFKTHRIPR
jgi:hypothetical protein